jgi:F0F1-type ATP synthase assembly protein I
MNMEYKENAQKRIPSFIGASLTTLGWELALPIFGGVFLGYQIDKLIGTNYIFTLGLLFLGIGAGYYSLIKRIELEMLRIKLTKRQAEKKEPTS